MQLNTLAERSYNDLMCAALTQILVFGSRDHTPSPGIFLV
jgi:hypothetical protein